MLELSALRCACGSDVPVLFAPGSELEDVPVSCTCLLCWPVAVALPVKPRRASRAPPAAS